MINKTLIIKKLSCKDKNTQAYRVFWEGEQYLGYILVNSDNRIDVATRLNVPAPGQELNSWKEFPEVVTKEFSRNTVQQLVVLFANGIPEEVVFEGFKLDGYSSPYGVYVNQLAMDTDVGYIKNSLLKILETPVYSIDQQIFNAFMNRS